MAQPGVPELAALQLTATNAAAEVAAVAPDMVGLDVMDLDDTDLKAMTLRQLNEDVAAYKSDIDFCTMQLAQEEDLSPSEKRALRLRVLDRGHFVRHAQHRIESWHVARARAAHFSSSAGSATRPADGGNAGGRGHASASGTPMKRTTGKPRPVVAKRPGVEDAIVASKRPCFDGLESLPAAANTQEEAAEGPFDTTAVQRLGFWNCRLCTSPKYEMAGEGRQPSAPCKWPLRDIAKMMTHYFDLHTEHKPAERCAELGDALDMNRECVLPIMCGTHQLSIPLSSR